jgi:hypothetical protein
MLWMTLRLLPLAALLLSLAAAPLEAAIRYVSPGGSCGGASPCYATIQDAIDAAAPGDVIYVQPGLYVLTALINVTTSVRILGPQADVNPLPSRGTTRTAGDTFTEAVIDGGGSLATLLRIAADEVEINGLEFRNGTGDLVDSQTSLPTRDVSVRNNIIHDSSGDEGVQLRAVTRASIECNHVYGTTGDGINLCCESADGVIRYNEIHDIASMDAAVYVYNSDRTSVQGNLVYNTSNNEGIKFGAKHGEDAARTGGSVVGNTIHDTRQDGIAVYTSHTLVRCNEVHHSASENGGIYLAWAITDVTVRENYVHDNTFDTFKWGDPAGIMVGTGVDAAGLVVSDNRLAGNLPNGMTNRAVALLVAENNWWGSATGPGGAGPGSGDAVSTNVDSDPWLTAPAMPSCPAVEDCGEPVLVTPTTWGSIKSRFR